MPTPDLSLVPREAGERDGLDDVRQRAREALYDLLEASWGKSTSSVELVGRVVYVSELVDDISPP